MNKIVILAIMIALMLLISACAPSIVEFETEILSISSTDNPDLVEISFKVISYMDDTNNPDKKNNGADDSPIQTFFLLSKVKDYYIGDKVTLLCRTSWAYASIDDSCVIFE
jgi:hypothetical protein